METLYLPIKHTHWLIITLSIILFNLRFWLRFAKPERPLHLAWKIVSYSNDTILLFTGMMMVVIAKWQLFGAGAWLGAKLLFVVGYIVLGIFAMRSPARSKKSLIFYAVAMILVLKVIWLAHCKWSTACSLFANWV